MSRMKVLTSWYRPNLCKSWGCCEVWWFRIHQICDQQLWHSCWSKRQVLQDPTDDCLSIWQNQSNPSSTEHGVNMNLRYLLFRCEFTYLKSVFLIFSLFSADLKSKDNFFWTPLHHACHCGQLDVVQLLVDSGADIDAQAINGGTPLMRSIESSKLDVVCYLISKGWEFMFYTSLCPLQINIIVYFLKNCLF